MKRAKLSAAASYAWVRGKGQRSLQIFMLECGRQSSPLRGRANRLGTLGDSRSGKFAIQGRHW